MLGADSSALRSRQEKKHRQMFLKNLITKLTCLVAHTKLGTGSSKLDEQMVISRRFVAALPNVLWPLNRSVFVLDE